MNAGETTAMGSEGACTATSSAEHIHYEAGSTM
jgi:hypothetical protein